MPADIPARTPTPPKAIYRFGEFELRSESGELFRDGVRLRLQEQSVQVLLALVENPGGVVTREELHQRLWPEGTYVDFERSLNAAIKRLRAALGDDADNPRYIETLPRRGYRLSVEVSVESTPQTLLAPSIATLMQGDSPAQPVRKPVRLGVIVTVLWVLIAAAASVLILYRHSTALFGTGGSAAVPAPPKNGEAYELYLRSLAYKPEFPANGHAITLLEKSVALDSNSARSWYELARRYNAQYVFCAPGEGLFPRAREANRHALELAPDFSLARVQKVMLDVEGGEVIPAYRTALAMTRAHPRDASSHFALSYALRSGGMHEEAARECDRALKLDPTNAMFRSCSLVYVLLGQYDRVPVFLDLDPLSTYVRYRRIELAILRDDKPAALGEARSVKVGPHDYPDARMIEAVLGGESPETVRNWSRETEALFDRNNDPEAYFVDARYLAWAGQIEPALRLLRRAIANNYCSYPVIDSDPLLANIRRLPEYKELREAAIACRERFRAQMEGR